VLSAPGVKIERVGFGCMWIEIQTSQDSEARAPQPEGKAATSRKKVENPGFAPLLQPGDLGPEMLVSRRSEAGWFHSGWWLTLLETANMPDQPAHVKGVPFSCSNDRAHRLNPHRSRGRNGGRP
jgi:hypothetical protein